MLKIKTDLIYKMLLFAHNIMNHIYNLVLKNINQNWLNIHKKNLLIKKYNAMKDNFIG